MVFAVQCPNQKCRKYQLVEEKDRAKVVLCLLCKTVLQLSSETIPTKEADWRQGPPAR